MCATCARLLAAILVDLSRKWDRRSSSPSPERKGPDTVMNWFSRMLSVGPAVGGYRPSSLSVAWHRVKSQPMSHTQHCSVGSSLVIPWWTTVTVVVNVIRLTPARIVPCIIGSSHLRYVAPAAINSAAMRVEIKLWLAQPSKFALTLRPLTTTQRSAIVPNARGVPNKRGVGLSAASH